MSSEKREVDFKPLLGIEIKPKTINWCASGLPKSKADVQQIPIAEMEKIIAEKRGCPNFKWSENFWVIDGNNSFSLNESELATYQKLMQDGLKLADKLALYWVNDEIGFGVCTIEDIQKDEELLYSGVIASSSSLLTGEKQGFALPLPENKNNNTVFAFNVSNFASFLNASLDMSPPTQSEIAQQHNILTPNFTASKDRDFGTLRANQYIKTFSPLVWDYGIKYWEKIKSATGENFMFINRKTGEPITSKEDPALYNEILQILFKLDNMNENDMKNEMIDFVIREIKSGQLSSIEIAFSICLYDITVKDFQQFDSSIQNKIMACHNEFKQLNAFLKFDFNPAPEHPIINTLQQFCQKRGLTYQNAITVLKQNLLNLDALIESFNHPKNNTQQSFGDEIFKDFLVSKKPAQQADPKKQVKGQLERITGLAETEWKIPKKKPNQPQIIWAQFNDEASRNDMKQKIEKLALEGLKIIAGKSNNKFILNINLDSIDLTNLTQQLSKINLKTNPEVKAIKKEFRQ